jgi:hypothetical protein
VALAYFLAAIPLIVGAMIGGPPGFLAGALVSVALWILIALAAAALNAIVLAAAYLYGAEGVVPPQFDAALLREAFVRK